MKDIFSHNADINKNAYLNWRTDTHQHIHNFNVIAKGYFENVLLTVQTCLEYNEDNKADILIFPILFSTNHGIELYVKSLCLSLKILLGYKVKFPENHDIRGIWHNTKQKVLEFGFGYGREEKEFIRMTKTLEAYLDEIYKKIMTDDLNQAFHNIDFSRYPLNNRQEKHFYVKTHDNVVIDLENLLNVVEDIYDCLSRLTDTYYDLVCRKWDMESER